MKSRPLAERILFNISRFVTFLLVISGIVTATTMLFLRDIPLDEALVRKNAPQTFVFVVLLSILGCVLDAIRRHTLAVRPLRRILEALNKIADGDFTARIDSNHRDFAQAGFREISVGINRLAKELGSVETLRTDFIASVSHELKTPLAAVGNYARLLRSPGLSEVQREEYTAAISQTTNRLADLIANILKLNKLENQQIYPETRVFDLGEQLAACILEYETVWDAKNLELECEIEDGVRVCADPELLGLVWSNLLSNAVKFTPEGGIIRVKLTTDGSWASVAFSDTGCGMTPETGAHIFEKFYQGDTAHATKGNGLGLALVKRVVDITGGVISVASTPGKGSTFTVRLGRVSE